MWRSKLRNDIIKNGVTPNKSKELSLPNLPDNLMKHYIRGYFDGNGCWTIKNLNTLSFSLISSVESFSYDLRNYLKVKCDLKTDVVISTHNNAHAFIYCGNIQTRRIYDYLYGDGGPWLDRKYIKSTDHFRKYESLN